MEVNPTRMCQLLVGLGSVVILGIDDVNGAALRVHVEAVTRDRRARAAPVAW